MLTHKAPPDNRKAFVLSAAICLLLLSLQTGPAAAYIGPGAGFALGGTFLFTLLGLIVGGAAVLLWPFRIIVRSIRRRRRTAKARAKRVVVLGLDGLDPNLARRWMREGKLPNLQSLQQAGGFRPLHTAMPAMSPVAWSSFSTGVDASCHNIFDFLSRDPATHMPVLSSTRISNHGKVRRLGPWIISRGKPRIELLRRSKPFWKILSEHGISSTILRVPITFPPDKFGGNQLSAMCTPDLRGTQGTFSFYSTGDAVEGETIGGVRQQLSGNGSHVYHSQLIGPDKPGTERPEPMTLPLTVRVDPAAGRADFTVDGQRFSLGPQENSPWIQVTFKDGRAKARGICKFRVMSFAEPFSFYVTPVHIDPESPAMPISHPPHFAIALAKLQGSYATLGLAEDTWGLNERVLDEQAFLDQAYTIHAERERQFFHALDRQRDGVVAVVFDATDRIQHMFFRYLDSQHPANRGKDTERHRNAIEDLYRRADDLVGRTVAALGRHDVLLVVSDHGFKQFQRGINLNTWFHQNGYLRVKGDGNGGPARSLAPGQKAEPAQIDWARTRAYTNGLGGAYLNLKGRERDGTVAPADAPALKQEIIAKLRGLWDEERRCAGITEVWDSQVAFQGPYRDNAPDLIIGYRTGYRADWDAAVGRVTDRVITDNVRSWSGDHCMDPRQVPGVLFCSWPFPRKKPALVDLAPSILEIFGIQAPSHMHGTSIFKES